MGSDIIFILAILVIAIGVGRFLRTTGKENVYEKPEILFAKIRGAVKEPPSILVNIEGCTELARISVSDEYGKRLVDDILNGRIGTDKKIKVAVRYPRNSEKDRISVILERRRDS